MPTKKIAQVSLENEISLQDVRTAASSIITWGKIKFVIGWMRYGTLERITNVSLKCENELEIPARTAALILLNNALKILMLYTILWRLIYYFVPSNVITAIVAEGKKKEESLTSDYLTSIILTTAMRDTRMNMTKKEIERFQVEQRMEKHGQ